MIFTKILSGMFFPNIVSHNEAAFLLVKNSYIVGTNIEVSMEIRPRAVSGMLFAVGGSTGTKYSLIGK